MTIQTTRPRARGRRLGLYTKEHALQHSSGKKRGRPLPEYLEKSEIDEVIRCTPNGRAKLRMLLQWRAGPRVSEALAL